MFRHRRVVDGCSFALAADVEAEKSLRRISRCSDQDRIVHGDDSKWIAQTVVRVGSSLVEQSPASIRVGESEVL